MKTNKENACMMRKLVNRAIVILLLSTIFVLATTSCNKDENSYSPYCKGQVPVVATVEVSNITVTDALCQGKLISSDGSYNSGYGFVWSSTNLSPTTSDNKIYGCCKSDSFIGNLRSLHARTIYFVRAFYEDCNGIAYGNIITFQTKEDGIMETFKDPRDGTEYRTITIGNDTWMAENLKYLPQVHSNIEFRSCAMNKQPAYGVYGYNGSDTAIAKSHLNYKIYGVLYNWHAVNTQKLCPDGWCIPSSYNWRQLGDQITAGGKLKETGTVHWSEPNQGATNESGFTALPGGFRNILGNFQELGNYGLWWDASGLWDEGLSRFMLLSSSSSSADIFFKQISDGLSVRCKKCK